MWVLSAVVRRTTSYSGGGGDGGTHAGGDGCGVDDMQKSEER